MMLAEPREMRIELLDTLLVCFEEVGTALGRLGELF